MAGRLWWMLRYFGLSQVALLDGGHPKWLHEDRPIETGISTPSPAPFPFVPTLHPEMLASTSDVEKIRSDPAYLLVDARISQRFSGETEPIDPVAGHIPGAVNRFHAKNITPDGVFKPASRLRAEYEQLLKDIPTENVVVYCGSGVTSCHLVLAMEMIGLKGARLYGGSWSEWIRDPARPIAVNA